MTDETILLRDYFALRAAGSHAAAAAAAQKACAAAPDSARAQYALGEAMTALGDDAGAVQGFAAALRLAPNWADAWVNLGLARYRQGAIGPAKLAMREALRVAPEHPAATANLGAFMRISGEAEAGEALLRETLRNAPEAAGVRLNLAAYLLQRRRGAEALELLDTTPALPTALDALRQWHLTRGDALLQLGRAATARNAIDAFTAIGPVPPELAPQFFYRQLLLAAHEGDGERTEAAARQMAAALEDMGPNAVPEHRIMGHYDLAKFWSGRGNAAAAFAHWRTAHGILRKSQPFSRASFQGFVDSIISEFGAARLNSVPRAANRDATPVFIVGMPRSGTTLCEQILAAHRDVHGAGERHALGALAWQLGRGDGAGAARRIATLDGPALDTAAERYLAELHGLAPDKIRIVDKMPGNELHLGLVGLMLPGAKIIHCVRDPRDIGYSIWTFRFHGEHPYAHDLADLGWTIAQRARLMAHWREVLPNPILTVALEDWVRDFDATLARVLTHLDLPPDPACALFYEVERDVRTVSNAQVRRPVNADGIGRWRPYKTQLAPLLAELEAAGMLAGWG